VEESGARDLLEVKRGRAALSLSDLHGNLENGALVASED